MKFPEMIKELDKLNDIFEDSIEVTVKYREFPSNDNYIMEKDEISEKLIKEAERLIRRSYEYKKYIKYLKNELDITTSRFIPQIDIKNIKGVTLEFHHFPFTLYDITEAVMYKLLEEDEEEQGISMFRVADVVMREHFKNNIGLVPLTKTLHEMAHNNALKIPLKYVYGNYEKFYNEYKDYLSQDAKNKYNIIKTFNDTTEAQIFNKHKLKKRIIKYKANINETNEEDE